MENRTVQTGLEEGTKDTCRCRRLCYTQMQWTLMTALVLLFTLHTGGKICRLSERTLILDMYVLNMFHFRDSHRTDKDLIVLNRCSHSLFSEDER